MLKAYETSGNYLFGEKEKFPKWLSWLMIVPLAIVAGLMVMLPRMDEADRQEMWIALAIVLPLQVILIIVFQKAKLEKVVTSNGLYFRWLPLQKKFRVIEKEMIRSVSVTRAPVLNYGSNWVPGYGRMHMASKGEGVEVIKTDGKKIFFSAADPYTMVKALEELIRSNSKTRIREF